MNWPKTLDEAVDFVLANISTEDKNTLVKTKEKSLISFHHGFGTFIRNELGLWSDNKELLNAIEQHPDYLSMLKQYNIKSDMIMKVNGAIHPDDASMVIIKAVWKKLHTKSQTRYQILKETI